MYGMRSTPGSDIWVSSGKMKQNENDGRLGNKKQMRKKNAEATKGKEKRYRGPDIEMNIEFEEETHETKYERTEKKKK